MPHSPITHWIRPNISFIPPVKCSKAGVFTTQKMSCLESKTSLSHRINKRHTLCAICHNAHANTNTNACTPQPTHYTTPHTHSNSHAHTAISHTHTHTHTHTYTHTRITRTKHKTQTQREKTYKSHAFTHLCAITGEENFFTAISAVDGVRRHDKNDRNGSFDSLDLEVHNHTQLKTSFCTCKQSSSILVQTYCPHAHVLHTHCHAYMHSYTNEQDQFTSAMSFRQSFPTSIFPSCAKLLSSIHTLRSGAWLFIARTNFRANTVSL